MYDKNYYLTHREETLARVKKWREEHPEQYRKALKKCVKRNGLKYKIQQKIYRCANWCKIELQQKGYYEKNRDKIKERNKQYRQTNEDKLRRMRQKYKLKKRYAHISGWVITYEIQEGRFRWSAIKGKFKITDEKESGFPTMHSAYKNATKCLGNVTFRCGK